MKKQIAVLGVAVALAWLGGYGRSTAAGSLFPSGITIVVASGSSGTIDTGARLLQPYLQKALGVPVVVENIPGAGAITGAHYVFTQAPDAPILLMAFLPQLTLSQVIGKGAYDMRKLTPVYGVYGHDTSVIIARKGSPYVNFGTLNSATAQITAAVAGLKTSGGWQALAELSEVNGIRVVPVPFKGGAEGADAALGGAVDVSVTTLILATRLIGAGKAQAVLQFAAGSLPQLPGVESIAKVGRPSEVINSVMGLTGPPNMSKDKVHALSAALDDIVKDPAFINRAKTVGLEIEAQQPGAWGTTMAKSYETINQEAPALEKFTGQ